MLPAEIEQERLNISAQRSAPKYRPYVGRDGQSPSVDTTKVSDFNPLGFPTDGDEKKRRAPRTIKGRHQKALAEANEDDLPPETEAVLRPRAVGDRLVKSGYGLAEHLEPSGGRALQQLRESSHKDEID